MLYVVYGMDIFSPGLRRPQADLFFRITGTPPCPVLPPGEAAGEFPDQVQKYVSGIHAHRLSATAIAFTFFLSALRSRPGPSTTPVRAQRGQTLRAESGGIPVHGVLF